MRVRAVLWIGLMGLALAWHRATAAEPAPRVAQVHTPRPVEVAPGFLGRPPGDEIIYFLLPDRFANADPSNDRGGLEGDRLKTGFDPTSKAFYNGGDLAGVTAHLDYIQSLGATAVWLAPIFKNKSVQGAPGQESAGYHGYWVTDFTRVDPHFGDEQALHKLIEAAHERGMKVYLDIITNHTADVISYRECPRRGCAYRPRAAYPTPYTPFVPKGEEQVKVPAWLNDTNLYHNRGNSTFAGESVELGDFSGLDDLNTEDPRVVQGFTEIFTGWIDRFHIDGYRIDTARHVNVEFWRSFVPAMLARAKRDGIPNFHVFGEVATMDIDVPYLARYTRDAKFPAVLDFGFANAVRAVVAGNKGTNVLARLFEQDRLYEGGAATALQLPTFISNHDMGRFAWFVRSDRPQAADDEVMKRVMLANAMLFTLRGVPVVYYGDEQGFAGTGNDQDARQDMFATQVAVYRADRRLGVIGGRAAASDAFDGTHPLYRGIAELAALRKANEPLHRGRQIVRASSEKPGLFAVSRIGAGGQEIVVAFNTSERPLTASFDVSVGSTHFRALHGSCATDAISPATTAGTTSAPRYAVSIPPLNYIVCASGVAQ